MREYPYGDMPTKHMLDWATTAIGTGARIVKVETLHGDQGPWRLRFERRGVTTDAVLRAPTPRIDAQLIATGAAALEVAEQHGLSAPRLIAADLHGDMPATLETAVPGTTEWPPSVKRLREAGAALARIHAVDMAPQDHLPFRPRPIAVDDFATDRRDSRMPTTPLLQTADDIITAYGVPPDETVYLHGDVWPGNMLWTGDTVAALIDWKTAGVGAPGVDVSELRKQVAITFDQDAPKHVLEGWEHATGRNAANVAYWDAVAALNTPTYLEGPATERRDAFLRAALANLA